MVTVDFSPRIDFSRTDRGCLSRSMSNPKEGRGDFVHVRTSGPLRLEQPRTGWLRGTLTLVGSGAPATSTVSQAQSYVWNYRTAVPDLSEWH